MEYTNDELTNRFGSTWGRIFNISKPAFYWIGPLTHIDIANDFLHNIRAPFEVTDVKYTESGLIWTIQ